MTWEARACHSLEGLASGLVWVSLSAWEIVTSETRHPIFLNLLLTRCLRDELPGYSLFIDVTVATIGPAIVNNYLSRTC